MSFPEHLPVPIGGLSPEARKVCVLTSLDFLYAEAAEHEQIASYARRANRDIFLARAAYQDPPYARGIANLKGEYAEFWQERRPDTASAQDGDSDEAKMRKDKFTDGISGLLRRTLMQDMAGLHTDVNGGDASSTELFKSISNARIHGSNRQLQRLYAMGASTMGLRQGMSLRRLELLQYRAQIAFNAGVGRFRSFEEVDAWRNDRIARIPYVKRSRYLLDSWKLFSIALGAKPDSPAKLPSDLYKTVAPCFDVVKAAGLTMEDNEVPLVDLETVRLEEFDQQMPWVVRNIEQQFDLAGEGWDGGEKAATAAHCSEQFMLAAQTLAVRAPEYAEAHSDIM